MIAAGVTNCKKEGGLLCQNMVNYAEYRSSNVALYSSILYYTMHYNVHSSDQFSVVWCTDTMSGSVVI